MLWANWRGGKLHCNYLTWKPAHSRDAGDAPAIDVISRKREGSQRDGGEVGGGSRWGLSGA